MNAARAGDRASCATISSRPSSSGVSARPVCLGSSLRFTLGQRMDHLRSIAPKRAPASRPWTAH